MRLLLDAGVSLSIVDTPTTRNTPLHWAASFASSEDVFNLFIEYNVDVNVKNNDGAIPLHEAVEQNNKMATDILLAAGANLDIVAEKGKFGGKSPKDLMKLLEINSQELEDKINLHDLHINSTLSLADEDNIQIAKVHSSTSRESPISNISVEFNINNSTTAESLSQAGLSKESVESSGHPENKKSSYKFDSGHTFDGVERSSPVPPLITDERLNLIWPQPKHVHQLAGTPCRFRKRLTLTVSPGPVSIHE